MPTKHRARSGLGAAWAQLGATAVTYEGALSELHQRDEGDELMIGPEKRECKWVKVASAADGRGGEPMPSGGAVSVR